MQEDDRVREHSNELDVHLSMGTDGVPVGVLRELSDVGLPSHFGEATVIGEV